MSAVLAGEAGVPGWWRVGFSGDSRSIGGWLVLVADAAAVADETVAQRWLASRLGTLTPAAAPPPGSAEAIALQAVAPTVEGQGQLWLVAPRGWSAAAPQNQVQGPPLFEGLGAALRRLHDLEPDETLSVVGHEQLLDRAAERVVAGAVDPETFDASRRGLEPARLLEAARSLARLLAGRAPVRSVVTHGACRPEAVWLDGREPTGFVAAAGLTVTDPYRDLAAMARRLAARHGAEGPAALFAAYGLTSIDPIRLEFHVLLDELL